MFDEVNLLNGSCMLVIVNGYLCLCVQESVYMTACLCLIGYIEGHSVYMTACLCLFGYIEGHTEDLVVFNINLNMLLP